MKERKKIVDCQAQQQAVSSKSSKLQHGPIAWLDVASFAIVIGAKTIPAKPNHAMDISIYIDPAKVMRRWRMDINMMRVGDSRSNFTVAL